MDLVSIIIPNYNREDLVVETVQNMLDQDYPHKEILVVDDGSTDNSIENLKSFGNVIRIITQKNQGPGAARNSGIAQAEGTFIQLMDSDDLASKNKISSQIDALKAHNADAVYGPWGRFEISRGEAKLEDCIIQTKEVPINSLIEALARDWTTVLQTFLFRKSIIEKTGPFNTEVKYLEDIEYLVRLLAKGAKVVFDDQALTIYRLNSFEKLSGSGTTLTEKYIAEIHFFEAVVSNLNKFSSEEFKWVKNKYRRKAANRRKELQEQSKISVPNNNFPASTARPSSALEKIIMRAFRRWRKGLRYRFKGWRYSPLYGPGPINQKQIDLLADIKLSLTSQHLSTPRHH